MILSGIQGFVQNYLKISGFALKCEFYEFIDCCIDLHGFFSFQFCTVYEWMLLCVDAIWYLAAVVWWVNFHVAKEKNTPSFSLLLSAYGEDKISLSIQLET